jgi:hypothetical protein
MTDYVHDHFHRHPSSVRPHIITRRGDRLSVQASSWHYCSPRSDDVTRYSAVEVWGPWQTARSRAPKSLQPYITTGNGGIATWVPVSVVNAYIARRGGVQDCPSTPF